MGRTASPLSFLLCPPLRPHTLRKVFWCAIIPICGEIPLCSSPLSAWALRSQISMFSCRKIVGPLADAGARLPESDKIGGSSDVVCFRGFGQVIVVPSSQTAISAVDERLLPSSLAHRSFVYHTLISAPFSSPRSQRSRSRSPLAIRPHLPRLCLLALIARSFSLQFCHHR